MVTTRRVPGRFLDTAPVPEVRYVRTVDSPNCTGACGWIANVKEDIIIDLKPAADYPDPVYNPPWMSSGYGIILIEFKPH